MKKDRILKIIKGLNIFSIDDICIMADIDEIKAAQIIKELLSMETIIPLNDNQFKFVQKNVQGKM